MILIFATTGVVLGLSAPVLYIVWFYTYKQRALHKTSVIAQYDAPYNLSPAELGYLLDYKLTECEIYATLLHLEQRKIIAIKKHGSKLSIQNIDPKATLQLHEERLIQILQQQSKFNKTFIQTDVVSVFKLYVLRQLKARGFLKDSHLFSVLVASFFIITTALYLYNIHVQQLTGQNIDLYRLGWTDPLTYIIGLMAVVYIPLFCFATLVQPWIESRAITKKLQRAWPAINGYRLYLEKTDRNYFSQQTRRADTMSTASAPYVISLGLYPQYKKLFFEDM